MTIKDEHKKKDEHIHAKEHFELPQAIVSQFKRYERRLCGMETLVAVCGGAIAVALTFGLLFASDRYWDSPSLLRGSLLTLGLGVLVAYATWWLHHWILCRRDRRALARLVRHKYHRFGDRLLGAVELANGELPDNVSPALCRAAIRQVAAETRQYDLRDVVEKRTPRIYSLLCGLLLVLVLTPLVMFPDAGFNAFMRWLRPFAMIERFTFVRLEDMPDTLVVAHGEPFEIRCRLQAASQWRPPTASCRLENQPRIDTELHEGEAVFSIPGQIVEGLLAVTVGDATREVRVQPVMRSEMTRLDAYLEWPAYLKQPPGADRIENGRIELLEGCRVRFRSTVNRALRSARMIAGVTNDLIPSSEASRTNVFRTGSYGVEGLRPCVFQWVDHYGMAGAAPYPLDVAAISDEPPTIEGYGTARSLAILKEEVVSFDFLGEDDFGISNVWVTWSYTTSQTNLAEMTTRVLYAYDHGNDQEPPRSLEKPFDFSPIAVNVPEESLVTLQAHALDFKPGRKPSSTLIYRIYVLSRAAHASLIRERMEMLQDRVEELTKEEERLLAENEKLKKLSPEQLADPKAGKQLEKHEQRERKHGEDLDKMAKQGAELLKEAIRNKEVPESIMRRWGELMQNMEQVAAKQMPKAAEHLQQAAKEAKDRDKNLGKAMEQEREIIKSLRKMEKAINKSIEDTLAMNFVNRLLKAADEEQSIGNSMKEMLPRTIGQQIENLAEDDQQQLSEMADLQEQTRERADFIRDDLAGFFNRTRMEIYRTIYTNMNASKMTEELGGVAKLIRENKCIRTIKETGRWNDRFREWAQLLQQQTQCGSGQGQGQGQQLDEANLEAILALMRIRKREESLREQTRVLDAGRAENQHYNRDARILSDLQNELAADVRSMERTVFNRKLEQLIAKVGGEMMNAGLLLRKPRTDGEVIAIETEIIELLAGMIQMGQQQCGDNAQAMAMMRMMGMMMGKKGGGSNAGGDTDDPNDLLKGTEKDRQADARDIEKTGALDGMQISREFKTVMEAYFNALEQE